MKYYKKFSNQIEISLLSLALLAILSYLINLLGIFKQNNLSDIYESFTLVVDLIFVFDFLIKIFVYRSHYFKGPWWFIDLIATLPILASLGAQFNLFESLRITRTVRYFYILRILRIVRLTKLFKYMQFESNKDEIESISKISAKMKKNSGQMSSYSTKAEDLSNHSPMQTSSIPTKLSKSK